MKYAKPIFPIKLGKPHIALRSGYYCVSAIPQQFHNIAEVRLNFNKAHKFANRLNMQMHFKNDGNASNIQILFRGTRKWGFPTVQ